ncbi:hypothetical protein [Enterobacter sp.]|uniref:hypothetical protein n=1 Tax=Enterobacter sp. TaxID=42895 RepID=UPI003D0BC384
MNVNVIKSFLVSLGFDIDGEGEKKFNAVLTGVTLNALKAGAAVEAAALSVVAFTAKTAAGLDRLYQVSQRTGASVAGIQRLGYALSQAGGSADAARSSIEGLASFIRNNPGAEGFLNRLGVQTRDASGKMRDMASVFTGVGQKLDSMPYYRARQYAQMLGIDDNTLQAMRRGLGMYGEQYSAMAKAIGFNADKAAASSNKFMTSLKAFGTMAGMARDKIGSDMAGGLTGSLDRFRKQILDNFPKIESVITRSMKWIMGLADMVSHLVYRLIDGADSLARWWGSLDKPGRELIEMLGALTLALRVLNMEFWRSPVGIITALAAAIFLLWDDYRTWKEGGKSLIDWSKWKPDIDKAKKNIRALRESISDLKDKVMTLLGIDPKSWSLKWDMSNAITQAGEFGKMLGKIADLLNAINEGRWGDALKISKQLLQQGGDKPDALPAVSGSANDAAAAIKKATGFDPRNVGGWIRAQLGLPALEDSDIPEQHAQSAHRQALPDRNNNPGNLRPAGGGGFRTFSSAIEGWQAMKNQLMRYFTGKTTGQHLQTVQDIVKTWAPAGDHNDPVKYAKDVAGWMHVSPDAVLNLTNPGTMASLMQSMARKEGYSNWNSPLAYRAAGAGISQQNTYHIYGGGDAREVGSEVERRQQSANARVMQTNQTRVG